MVPLIDHVIFRIKPCIVIAKTRCPTYICIPVHAKNHTIQNARSYISNPIGNNNDIFSSRMIPLISTRFHFYTKTTPVFIRRDSRIFRNVILIWPELKLAIIAVINNKIGFLVCPNILSVLTVPLSIPILSPVWP